MSVIIVENIPISSALCGDIIPTSRKHLPTEGCELATRLRRRLRHVGKNRSPDDKIFLHVIARISNADDHDLVGLHNLVLECVKDEWDCRGYVTDCVFQKIVNPRLRPEFERLILHVCGSWPKYQGTLEEKAKLDRDLMAGFDVEHNEDEQLRNLFSEQEVARFYDHGFWEDDRFLSMRTVKSLYQNWLKLEEKARERPEAIAKATANPAASQEDQGET